MAIREAGIRLSLQGGAEYKAGLKGISQELRTMSTESKLAVAQLGNNASMTDTYRTSMNNLNNQIKVSADRTKMLSDRQRDLPKLQQSISQEIEKTTKAYKDSQNETRRLKSEYDKLAQSQDASVEEIKEAEQAWNASKRATASLKTELNQLSTAYNQNEKELAKLPNELAKSELATQRLRNEMERMHTEFRNSGGRLADTAKQWKDMGETLTTTGERMSQAGSWMTTRFTLPIIAGLGAAVKTGLSFDQQMRQTAAIAGLTAEDLNVAGGAYEQLREQAIQLGADSIFGATDVAAAQEMMASAGLEVVDIIGAIPGVMDLAAISGKDMALASEAVATALNQFGLEATDATHVADVFARAAADTNAETSDMAEALSYAGNVAGSMGIQFEEVAAAIGIMSNAGVTGSMAGTALRGAFTRLANPTKQVTSAMEDLGWSAYDAEGNMKPLTQMIPELRDSLEGLTNEQRDQYLASIFGTNALSGMLALVNSAPGELEGLVSSLENSTGAAQEMADVINSGPNGAIENLMGAIETLSIQLFDALAPSLTNVVDGITDVVEWFSELDQSTQNNIVQWGLWLAAAGPVLSMLGSITTGAGNVAGGIGSIIQQLGKWTTPTSIGGTATAIGGISTSIGSILPAIALGALAIAGLGGVYWYLNSESQKAHRRMEEFPDISGLTEPQAEALRAITEEATELTTELKTIDTATDFTELNGNIETLGGEITTLNDEKINTLRENFSTLPGDIQASLAGALEDTIANIEAQTTRVQTVVEEMNRLTKQGLDENGVLQAGYVQVLKGLNDEMMSYYSLSLADSAQQQAEIYQYLTADVTEMTQQQLSYRLQYLNDSREQETQLYQQQQDALFTMWQEQAITQEEFNTQNEQITLAHNSRMDALNRERVLSSYAMFQEIQEQAKGTSEEGLVSYQDFLKTVAEDLGLTIQEVEAILNSTDFTKPVKNLIQAAEDASPALKTAVNEWNIALLDFANQAGKAVEDLGTEDLQNFVNNIEQTGLSWADLQLITKDATIDDNTKELINNAAEAQGGWDALLLEEKQARVTTFGEEELAELVSMFGHDWESLDPETKQAIIEAEGGEALEQALFDLGLWIQTSDPAAKRVVLETQIDSQAILAGIEARGLWNNAEFVSQLAEIDTNAPDAREQIVNLINQFSALLGLPPIQIETNTNAETSTDEIVALREASTGANNTSVNVNVSAAGASAVKDDINTIRESAEQTDGKSVTVVTDILSMVINTVAVGAWNAVVGAMKDESSTVTTNIPNMLGNTLAVLGWNTAGRAMFNKTSTLTTRVPGISGNTSAGWSWISMLNSAYNRTSTLTTRRVTAYITTGVAPRGYAEGGHIDAYADGGNIKWGGMFANGGNVPRGYMGIVGEAGPELFQVTRSGVSITPLSPAERARGINGVIEDAKGGSDRPIINITVNNPTVREDEDINRLTDAVVRKFNKALGKQANQKRTGRATRI